MQKDAETPVSRMAVDDDVFVVAITYQWILQFIK